MQETKVKILDAAEKLFGMQGYAATSLRHIVAEADVNLAAIHYHFGSKEELLDQLVMRKAAPVNEERLKRLDRVEAEAAGRPPRVEDVLEAFFRPVADAADRDPQFVRMMGRIIAEGMMAGLVEKHFKEVAGRAVAVLRRAVPEIGDEEFLWRVHFMVGALTHTMCGGPDFTHVGEEPGGFGRRIDRLIAFLSGGMRATASKAAERESEQAELPVNG